jgi:hypothetical protein
MKTLTSHILRPILLAAVVLGLVCVALVANARTASADGFTTNIYTPIAVTIPNPCNGDLVSLTGTLHEQFHITIDSAGGANLEDHFNPQDVTGTGSPSGAKYQATGVTRDNANFTPGALFVTTFVNNFRIIGQGPDNNFMVHENAHVTVNPNGTVTSFHDNFSITCQ